MDNIEKGILFGTIDIGDIFMIDSRYFEKFAKCHKVYINGESDKYSHELIESDEKKLEDILLIVKYIGEGMIQEMLTGEIFQIAPVHYYNRLPISELKNYRNADINLEKCDVKINFEEHKGCFNNKEFVNKLNNYKNITLKSPLSYFNICYFITDDTKKRYLKYTNEQRIDCIKKMMAIATKSREIVINEVNSVITSYFEPLSNEIMEMAYLENKIYDFERKTKYKKY